MLIENIDSLVRTSTVNTIFLLVASVLTVKRISDKVSDIYLTVPWCLY